MWHWVHVFENGIALVNEGGGIGVLVAHLDDDGSVNVLLLLKAGVAGLEVIESLGGLLESPLVGIDLVLVVSDVRRVLINIRSVLVAEGLSVLDSVLEVGSGESESLGGDQHVGGLGDLELVVLSAEEGISVLELLNLRFEVWKGKVSGAGIAFVVLIMVVVIHGFVSDSGGDQKGGGKGFHCRLKFIDYKLLLWRTFMNPFLNF